VQLWAIEYQLMAGLWTPDGERPVPDFTDDERAQAEALAREMAEVREQLARTPAAVVVANHVMGFYELAAIHLSQQPANFSEATVAIDAMSSVLDKLRGRLGENEQVLRDALAQLQVAFVQLQGRDEADLAADLAAGDVDGG
jgi:hypothetical protein